MPTSNSAKVIVHIMSRLIRFTENFWLGQSIHFVESARATKMTNIVKSTSELLCSSSVFHSAQFIRPCNNLVECNRVKVTVILQGVVCVTGLVMDTAETMLM
jgi:hypothetical protein